MRQKEPRPPRVVCVQSRGRALRPHPRLISVALASPATLRLEAADRGLVGFDGATEAVCLGSRHRTSASLQYRLCRLVPSQAGLSLKRNGGEFWRVCRHQIGCRKPQVQRSPRAVQDCTRPHRYLVSTPSALQQSSSARLLRHNHIADSGSHRASGTQPDRAGNRRWLRNAFGAQPRYAETLVVP